MEVSWDGKDHAWNVFIFGPQWTKSIGKKESRRWVWLWYLVKLIGSLNNWIKKTRWLVSYCKAMTLSYILRSQTTTIAASPSWIPIVWIWFIDFAVLFYSFWRNFDWNKPNNNSSPVSLLLSALKLGKDQAKHHWMPDDSTLSKHEIENSQD